MSGGVIAAGTFIKTVDSLNQITLTANALVAGSPTLTILSANGLTKAGPGQLIISGNSNTYTGTNYITAGTLTLDTTDRDVVGGAGNLGNVPLLQLGASVILNGGILQASDNVTISPNRLIAIGPMTANGYGTLDVADTKTLVYRGLAPPGQKSR